MIGTRLATVALASVTAVGIALPTAVPAAARSQCPAVQAVAVPGTTQTHPKADPSKPVGVLGKILEPIRQRSQVPVSTYYTPYPATIVGGTDGGGYRASKEAGIRSVNARLQAVSKRCPKTSFVLAGYSQGADVAGDVAAVIGNGRGVIPVDRLLGVTLIADPSQAPSGQPTIGLTRPGVGFAGVRSGGFGSLAGRDGILSLCHSRDYYCNLPQDNVVMRFIGHLGSHLDASDPGGSAQKLATIFVAGLIAPATAAIQQILTLVNDPNLIPNLIQRGMAFARSLAQQLFALGGPQVAAAAADLVNAVNQVINLIKSRAWASIPSMIATLATKATATGTALAAMNKQASAINTSGFSTVGQGLNSPQAKLGQLTNAVLNAVSVATGGLGMASTGAFGPTFAQFSPASVAAALKRFAEFIAGGFHTNYDSVALDRAGHTGVQIAQRYILNHLNKLV